MTSIDRKDALSREREVEIRLPKPSELPRFLAHAVPYTNTFGRTEREIGAALYVEACRANGDTWQPVDPPMMGAAIRGLAALDPIPSWVSFMGAFGLMPDIHGLCKEGFFTKDTEHGPITPTNLFFERVERWATPSTTVKETPVPRLSEDRGEGDW